MEQSAIKSIIESKDVNALLSLDEYDFGDFLTELNYTYFSEMPFEKLNHEQKVLFLCMKLEDACQADTITSLAEDGDMLLKLPEIRSAHEEIGAPETAGLIQNFIDLLPDNTFEASVIPDWDWFFENEEREDKISEIDGDITDYPDGVMRNVFRRYCSDKSVAEKILSGL